MAGDNKDKLDYWHGDTSSWTKEKPGESAFMMAGLCHESSTLYMSDDLASDEHASVDPTYKVFGTGNVYATGSAIFPAAGSWNRAC